jgi:spermidine/putrescine transport system substrate-binding protein
MYSSSYYRKMTNLIRVVFPDEGIGFGIMANFIPANAPNADAAYAFIDYILRPEISAKCFEWLGYYCTNKAAEQYISAEYKEYLTLPADFSGDMEMIQPISAEA